jgi:peptide/nickel transport system substrate-binding protein
MRRKLLLILLVAALALVAAQCGAVATEEPAPAVQDEAPAVEEEAEAKTSGEEKSADEEEVAAEDTEPMEEATEEPVEEEAEEVAQTVEESKSSQELNLGASVVSDEEVTSPRDPALAGGEYRDVATSDAVSFHPYMVSDGASFGYQGMVYSSALLRLDEDTLEYIPNMAESYTISDDGLTFTFKLREGLKWSDGEPMTAYDYKWTYDQAINPDNEYPYLSQLEFITSYEALDERTLEIKIDEVYAPALGQMSGLIRALPKHIWEDLDWGDPDTNPEIMNPSVVSGPYKLAEWKRDQYVIFEANENYWYHGAPNITRQIQEIVP